VQITNQEKTIKMSVDNPNQNLNLVIVTPTGEKFNNDIAEAVFPGQAGDIGVLPDHTPLVSTLRLGQIKTRLPNSKKFEFFSTTGGYIEVEENKIKILAETAEAKSEIDVVRAKESQARAEERITVAKQKRSEEIDLVRAESSLFRAKNRLEVALMK
jgi:F-type H+-transporting ATPase subunit epsilon